MAIVRLEWFRDPEGYRMVDGNVVPRSGRVKRYLLEGTADRIFLEVANIDLSEEAVLEFVGRRGLLDGPERFLRDGRTEEAGKHPQSFEVICDRIADLKKAAELASSASKQELERRLNKRGVRLQLRYGRLTGDSSPRLMLDAENLYGFCQSEFWQLLEGGVEIRKCPRCGTLFALGRVGHQPTYCSNACRVAMHRRKKKNTLRLVSGASRRTAARA